MSAARYRDPATAWLGRRRAVGVLSWTFALLLPAGVGLALWSATGSGTGPAKARTAQALVLTAGSAVADLYPGATGDVRFSVANSNPYPVTVTSGTATAITTVTGGLGACTATDFTLGTGSVASTVIPANGSANVVLTGALTMKLATGDGCQGATVNVTATLNGTQS